jgi:PAS domain S-box-containing protein
VANESSSLIFAASPEVDEKSRLETLEASLRQREYELEEAHHIARLGTWRWNFVTDTVTWSKEVFVAFGLDPQGPIPRHGHMQSLHTPESWERMIAAVQRIRADGTPYALDLEIQVADGSWRWLHTRGEVAARGPDGEVTEARGTVQNVTERKLAEIQLREREQELIEANSLNKLGTWRVDILTGKVTWSEEIYRIFGVDPSLPALTPEVQQTIFTPESWQRLQDAFYRCRDMGAPYEADGEIHALDGVTRWIAVRGHASRRGAGGEILELRGSLQDVTERKQIEIQMREREQELSEAHRQNKLGTWRMDVPTAKVTWSEEISRIFGLDPTGPVPSPEEHRKFFTPESYERMTEALYLCRDKGVPYEVDGEIHTLDGVTRWIAARGRVARWGEYGEILELRGTVQDVTERKQTESMLRERERELLEIQRIAGVGAWRWVAATDELTWSEELYRIFERDPKLKPPLLAEHEAMMTPESWSRTVELLQKAKDHGESFQFDSELVLPSGKPRWITSIGEAVLDAQGNVVELHGTVRDITARKLNEQALHKANERLEAVLGGMTDGLAIRDREGRYTYFSEQGAEILGVDRDAVIGQIAWEVFPGTKETKFYRESQRALETGRPVHFEEYKPEPNGRWLECHCYPFEDGISVYFRDITLQKQSEEALRRTEKLAATGRLAASIAHEINNPLEAVTNSLYLALQDAALSTETRMYLKMAEQELARVSQLTTQTLRFHRQSVAAAEADLGELMDSAYELFASRFEACNIRIQREYQTGMTLFCRGDELRQVFANLLSNALDAMRHGGQLRIRIRKGHSWGRDASIGVRVVVCDSGTGIPPGLRKKIFEPFVSTKADTGTGLGLWVSEGIVKKHRGRISLYSHTGERQHGTVFSLFFPLDGINADWGSDIRVQAGDLP